LIGGSREVQVVYTRPKLEGGGGGGLRRVAPRRPPSSTRADPTEST